MEGVDEGEIDVVTLWNWCIHKTVLTTSPASYGAKQIEHVVRAAEPLLPLVDEDVDAASAATESR